MRQGTDLAELVDPELSAVLVLANAQLGEARATRDRIYARGRVERVAKLRIRAPSDGTVALLVAAPGEAVHSGPAGDDAVGIGRASTCGRIVRRLSNRLAGRFGRGRRENRIHARITEILARGGFAAWRTARVVRDPD